MNLLAQGSPWQYSWTPTWAAPYWIPGAIGVLCIAVVAICYLIELRGVGLGRRALLTMLRSTAILLLGWMLLGWSWTPFAEEPRDLIVLVDVSRSMLTEDVAEKGTTSKPVSRFMAAKTLLSRDSDDGLLAQLAKSHRLRLGVFSQETSWLPFDRAKQQNALRTASAEGDASRLGDAIHDALRMQRGRGAAAIVVLSDGVQTGGAELADAAAEAKAVDVPLYFVGLGEDRLPLDARIANLIYSPTAFLGDVVFIEADVETSGYPQKALRVSLKSEKGEILAAESITVRANQTLRVRLPIRPIELGDWKFTMELEKPDGDSNAANNIAAGTIRVQEESVRVLLVDRRPRYDFRFLIDVLSRARKRGAIAQAAFEIKTFLQEGDSGLSLQDSSALDAFPSSSDLVKFDVIVLGDIEPRLLGNAAQRDLLQAVTHHGVGLVILPSASVGMSHWSDQPLELLLPSRAREITSPTQWDSPRSAALTSRGAQTPFCSLGDKPSQSAVAWRTLPPLVGVLSTSTLRAEVRILIEAVGAKLEDGRPAPVTTSHFAGSGKVLCHWTDEWWRWTAPGTRNYYEQYWMQAIRGLCSPKSASDDEEYLLRTDAATYEEGAAVTISLQFRNEALAPGEDNGAVVSLHSDESSRQIVLSREEPRRDLFRAELSDLPPGRYAASVIRPAVATSKQSECRFEVTSRSSEMSRLRPDFASLQSAAKQSGGKFYTVDTARRLVAELPRGVASRTTPLPPRSAWNLPVWAALLVSLLGFEWFLRRASGLL